MISTRAIVLTVALTLLATAPAPAEGDGILGLWNTVREDHGYARIKVTKDGALIFKPGTCRRCTR